MLKKTLKCPSNSVTGEKNTFISHNLTLLKFIDNRVIINLLFHKGVFVIKLTRVKEHHLKIGGFNTQKV